MPRRHEISPVALLMRRIDAAADGAPAPDTISSGFPSIDKMLGGGFRRGDLIVLGGDVASGKSALALAFAIRAAQDGRNTMYLTGEMSVERLTERILAIEGRARVDDIRRGMLDEATRASIGAAAVRLRDHTPELERIPPGGIDALIEELRRTLDLELAIVDSLQALAVGPRTQDEELALAMRQLKRVAIDLGIAIVITAHLPGLSRERRDLRPQLDDFGIYGAVKQDADVILGLFREEMYQSGQGLEGATELLVLKSRNGGTGYVDLYFYKQWMRFEDMLDPDR